MTMLDLDPAKAFLGVGWSFPPQIAAGDDVELSVYEEDIRESIVIILGTSPGERVMRPDFGAGIRDLVFEPMNTTTMALIQHRVEQALVIWEPRIEVKEVTVTADDAVRGRLQIEIGYVVRSTNIFYNLVYPFYLLEGERP
jgi:hypothetical protein